jgi:hypothetical protein
MHKEDFEQPINPQKWWLYHRIKFNKGLLIGGMLAFALYTLFSGQIFSIRNAEVVSMGMLYECIGYFIYMVLANIAYTIGWLADILFNHTHSNAFRNIVFTSGYWFAVCLPSTLILTFFTLI